MSESSAIRCEFVEDVTDSSSCQHKVTMYSKKTKFTLLLRYLEFLLPGFFNI